MKVAVLFLLVIVALSHALENDDVLQKFKAFQEKFEKSYRSPVEEKRRFTIFKQNLERIEAHNVLYETGKISYRKGVNQFTDWTDQEFAKFVNRGKLNKPKITGEVYKKRTNFKAPEAVDWREQGAVTDVKNQGSCGSCWAFSTTGTIEGQLQIATGNLTSLSEQNLMDCSWYLDNNSCGGGEMYLALDYVQQNGIESEEDYPYTATDSYECKSDESKIVTKISSYVTITALDEEAVLEAVATKGPLSVALFASDNLKAYKDGVFFDTECEGITNHGVLMVGYGSEDGQDYYILKNSWATTWGESGYVRFSRNPTNMCGILTEARYPIL